MNKESVLYILNQLNESFSEGGDLYVPHMWLSADEIATISTQDERAIWPDDRTQIYFDTDTECLLVRYGKTLSGVFVPDGRKLIIKFSEILTINLVSQSFKKSAYRYGNTL